jgi:predicted deacylase
MATRSTRPTRAAAAYARQTAPAYEWNGEDVPPGESREVWLDVSESYSGSAVRMPIHVRRGLKAGPGLFVTAALHGDEINGTGAIRDLIADPDLTLLRGTLVLVPVLNVLAFERHSRYMPDRRDLNRAFPGNKIGSLAARLARTLFHEIVARCDYGIDLHTAAVRRTNYPHVRGNLAVPEIAAMASAFASEIVLAGDGPKGALRREASRAGCHTIVVEAGEVWKVEPSILESSARGIRNVLRSLDMISGAPERPGYQVVIDKSVWIRANKSGFLRFHVSSGDVIEKGQALATNTTLLGETRNVLRAPYDAIVIGMTTLPSITPGEPVFHLGRLPDGMTAMALLRLRDKAQGLEENVVDDLSSNVTVVEP